MTDSGDAEHVSHSTFGTIVHLADQHYANGLGCERDAQGQGWRARPLQHPAQPLEHAEGLASAPKQQYKIPMSHILVDL
jgi:hypothetical protein